ncbi:hypothetical protein G9A89_021095 [Geosiphon pyriformis]|nr:hypothetical protein G9A89_021095 [Geosiphon pyriformis]
MALINRATQEDVCQIKKDEYIEYTIELAEFNYKDKEEIELRKLETKEEIAIIPIYFIKNQSTIQLKYFDNNGKRIKPEKAHEINAGYNLRYSGKDTLVLQPKSLTKINLKIVLEIPPGAMV